MTQTRTTRRDLSALLAQAEAALASARAGDARLEATLTVGRAAAALREPRAPGLLLAALDLADELGREELGRRAALELGRALVRSGDVALGRGHLQRALGEAQRNDQGQGGEVLADQARAAAGLVEAWLSEGDLARAGAALSLAPPASPERAFAEGLVALAQGHEEAGTASLLKAAERARGLPDALETASLAHQVALQLEALAAPPPAERLGALSEDALRRTLRAFLEICEASPSDPWPSAAAALRRLSGAEAVELSGPDLRVQSPAQSEVQPTCEVRHGELVLGLQGAQAEAGAPLAELALVACARLIPPASGAGERVLHMLDRLVESDLEGAQLFDLATQLAVEATGAARGRLIRLSAGSERGWESEETSFVSRSLLRHVVLSGRPLLLEDASESPPSAAGESIGAKGLRSVVAAPLLGRRGQVLGVLYLDDPGTAGRFGAGEAKVVAGFAARLGTQLESELRAQLRAAPGAPGPAALVSPALLESASRSEAPLLICGESGVGKEHFAHAVHQASPQASGPFLVLPCSTVADELLESELFGHEAGAFTDAHSRREGLFQRAQGGVLFLEGLQDASPRLQAELLRAVETGEVRPLGGVPEAVQVRVMASYQGDPAEGVRQGRMRQDLYYRLSVLRIDLPPLRERRGELGALTRGILTRLGAADRELSAGALELIESYTWPGNLRELQACLERGLLDAGGDTLRARHLRLEGRAQEQSTLRLNARQLHVVSTLRPGHSLRSGEHATQWGISPATAWRDLTGLVGAGLLEAEGKGRGALYRLAPRARH